MADTLLSREAANDRMNLLERRLSGARERAKREAKGALRTVTQGVNGALLGVAEAQWGPRWFGVDPALLVTVVSGLASIGTSLTMTDQTIAEAFRASADGSFGIWTYKSGFAMNARRLRAAAQRSAGQLGAGAEGAGTGASVADEVRQAA